MKRAVERGLAKRDLDGIRYVGIDEKSFGKGQDYVSVMTDPKASRVIEVSEGRTEKSAAILWNSLTDAQKKQIAAVSIDMCKAYENSVASHAPQAEIVFDRFHISKHLKPETSRSRFRLTPDVDPKWGHLSDTEPGTSPPVPADNFRLAAVRCTRPTSVPPSARASLQTPLWIEETTTHLSASACHSCADASGRR